MNALRKLLTAIWLRWSQPLRREAFYRWKEAYERARFRAGCAREDEEESSLCEALRFKDIQVAEWYSSRIDEQEFVRRVDGAIQEIRNHAG